MALITANPGATREVEIRGAKFTIGIVPKDVYFDIFDMRGAGLNFEKLYKAVRYGVRGHAGILFEDGTEVPFETQKDAKGREIVNEKTMEIYLSAGVIVPLGDMVLDPNGWSRTEKSEKK